MVFVLNRSGTERQSCEGLFLKRQLLNRSGRAVAVLLLLGSLSLAKIPIILDTDMGNDIDDALALAILHTLTSREECELIGVSLTNANPAAVPYVQMVNRFYGRGGLPVGFALTHVEGG